MAKQLSLFVRDKQAVKILTAICAEKRQMVISAIAQLIIAHIRTYAAKERNNGE